MKNNYEKIAFIFAIIAATALVIAHIKIGHSQLKPIGECSLGLSFIINALANKNDKTTFLLLLMAGVIIIFTSIYAYLRIS